MNKTHYIIASSLVVFSILLYLTIKKVDLKPLYIILLGAGLAVVAAAFTAWGTFLQNERSSLNNAEIKETGEKTYANSNLQLEQIDSLKKQNDQLTLDLEKRDEKVEKQSEKIIELNEKLVEKSEYISDYLIGGQGFPFISPSAIKALIPTRDEQVTFTLYNDNTLPLYDITAVIMDWKYILSKQTKSDDPNKPYLKQGDLEKSIIHRFDIPQMFENSTVITREKFDLSDALLFIKLKSRSSFVHQKLAFVIENKVVYSGFLIHDSEGGILKEWITPGITPSAEAAIRRKFEMIPDKVVFTLTE